MFNLDKAIKDWRGQLAAVGLKSSAVRDELENHLREDVERRVESGTPEQEAFKSAIHQLGQVCALTDEFAKINETREVSARKKKFILALSGFQNPILATNMNTSPSNGNLEPAWATYLKFGAFALPAAVLWLLVAIFVFPKFNEVVLHSEIAALIPAFFRFGWNLALLLTHYLFVACGAFVFALALLEWRIEKWRRYRRAACGIGVFLLNSAVLVAITAMVIFSLVTLDHHAK